ncbi:zinc finger protein [Penicillium canescens]|uniref:Zinc finger protein n=1 Tax=Penicillium canescens TaxID=5083 RepID=A0AAD6N3T7_PENCN|nr:zinc finger protein [Penicillium canescens]KAJ6027475.1 zinc finger protein [Penicillium canescens]KAJ6040750.1 zinc finger protein [Penicillium canescens]KAJ6066896.1 zinc finger protein [Penicillium canescens]
MAIMVRRLHLWRLNQLPYLYRGSVQASSPIEDEGCLTKGSHVFGVPYSFHCTTNQATPISSLTSVPEACQQTPSNNPMTQHTIIPDETYPHTPRFGPCFSNPEHPVFGQQILSKPLFNLEPHFGTDASLNESSSGDQRPYRGLEVSVHQDLKHLNRKKRPTLSRSSGATLGSIVKPSGVKCDEHGCTKHFTTPKHLTLHKESHLEKEPFACWIPECHCTFSHSDNLRVHYKRLHAKRESFRRPFPHVGETNPDHNPKVFHNESLPHVNGNSHHQYSSFQVGSGDNPSYAPSVSDSSITSVAPQSTPVNVLGGTTTDSCSYPSKNTIFRFPASVTVSLVHHSTEAMHQTQNQATAPPKDAHQNKPYVCSTCYSAFSRPSQLRIHSRSHTDVKPFRCAYVGCGKSFSVRSNANRHVRDMHRNRPGRGRLQSNSCTMETSTVS